jgi:NAD(P)-dependent dehydrogenase (short-subunit alcohol dehydrogenase family)
MERLKDRVALITGGGAGIGREIALTFARHGACVAIVDIDEAGAEAVSAQIQESGGQALAIHCDVTAGEKGRVINMGSLAGQIGGIAVGAHYSVSKGGIMVLAKQLSKLLASDRVTVNSIAPGTTNTPLTAAWPEETRAGLVKQIPLGRLGEPRDIAELALFLASDAASYITGAVINVNGGLFIG